MTYYIDDQARTMDRVRFVEPDDAGESYDVMFYHAMQDVGGIVRARRNLAKELRALDAVFCPPSPPYTYPVSAIMLESLDEHIHDALKAAAYGVADHDGDAQVVMSMLVDACREFDNAE